MSDAREAIVNAGTDIITVYKASLSSPSYGLLVPATLQLLPLYLLSLLKSVRSMEYKCIYLKVTILTYIY